MPKSWAERNQTLDMVLESEQGRAAAGRVATDTLEDARAVVQRIGVVVDSCQFRFTNFAIEPQPTRQFLRLRPREHREVLFGNASETRPLHVQCGSLKRLLRTQDIRGPAGTAKVGACAF